MVILPLTSGLTRVSVEAGPLAPNEDISQTLKELTVERFEALAQEAAHPSTFKVLSTAWLTCFKINERRADQFVYKNRIFLAGDAAHIHSPAGGQGLNTGLQDAHNLAWKLAFVLNGLIKKDDEKERKEGEFLETYREREAMADRAINVSSKLLQRNRDSRLIARLVMRGLFTFGPWIAKCFKSFSFAPDVSMVRFVFLTGNDFFFRREKRCFAQLIKTTTTSRSLSFLSPSRSLFLSHIIIHAARS